MAGLSLIKKAGLTAFGLASGGAAGKILIQIPAKKTLLMKPGAQSFTSLMADLRQDINRVSLFSRWYLNGTFS